LKPRLLLNENIPLPAAAELRLRGCDVVTVAERGQGMTDEAVLKLAVRERRWIVTFDRDYGERVYGRGLPAPPAILLLREPHYHPTEPAYWVLDLIESEAAMEGWLTVYTHASVRRRPLIRSA